MSRIGKKVIPLPSGVKYKVEGNTVLVEGPKGKVSAMIAEGISLETKDGALHVDIGRATAIELPAKETERRLRSVTYQWPIMHTLLHGVTRDQFMARHRANHLNVAYAPTAEVADKALAAKAAMFAELGVPVHRCGD